MKRKTINPGDRFNRWTIIEEVERQRDSANKTYRTFKVECDCGTEKILRINHLLSNKSKSCGCFRAQVTSEKNIVHGLKHTRLYNIWNGMKQRCNNFNQPRYKDYGGRGIAVCDEWKNNFQAFYDWAIANGYSTRLTIDRINNDGNYEPSNCRWVTNSFQQSNKRSKVA